MCTVTPHSDLGWKVPLAQIIANEEIGVKLDEEEVAEGPTTWCDGTEGRGGTTAGRHEPGMDNKD